MDAVSRRLGEEYIYLMLSSSAAQVSRIRGLWGRSSTPGMAEAAALHSFPGLQFSHVTLILSFTFGTQYGIRCISQWMDHVHAPGWP